MSFSPDESPSDLWLERSNFVGGFLGAIAYGVFITLFFATAYVMLYKPAGGHIRVADLIYAILLFSGTTVNVAAGIKWNQMTWIDYRNYPGGPVAFTSKEFSNWVSILASAAYTLDNILADGLVLYRCLIIWQDRYIVICFPVLLFFASTVLSILSVVQEARPGASLWTRHTVNVALPFWSLSISLNIIVTCLIASRLLMMSKRLRDALGSEHAKKYTSVVAMLVESAALYSITGLFFTIAYARNSNLQNLVLPVLCSVQSIAPLLILFRVALGNGFSRDTTAALTQISEMSFSPPQTTSLSADSSVGYLDSNLANKKTVSSKDTMVPEWDWNKSQTSGHRLHSGV